MAVQTLQCRPACPVQLHISSYSRTYNFYRTSVLVHYNYTFIPLRSVWPLQSLSACKVEPQLYSTGTEP